MGLLAIGETSVRRRFFFTFGVILVLAMSARAFEHWVDVKRRDRIDALYQEYFEQGSLNFIKILEAINESSQELARSFEGAEGGGHREIDEIRGEIRSGLAALLGQSENLRLRSAIQEALKNHGELARAGDRFRATLVQKPGEQRASPEEIEDAMRDLWREGSEFMADMLAIGRGGLFGLDRDIMAARQEQSFLEVLSTVVYLCVLVICVALVLSLIRSVTRPISALAAGVEEFSQGNLTPTISIDSRDEFGRLAHVFGQMSEEIGRMLNEGKRVSDLALMVCSTLDVDEIARRLLNVVRQFTGAKVVTLTMETGGADQWMRYTSREFDHCEKEITNDIDGGQVKEMCREAGSVISVPLIAQQKVIGSLELCEHTEGANIERQAGLVSSILVSVSMALRNAQVFEELLHEKENVAMQAKLLAAANTELEESQRFKSRFLAGMSHRLRTPMNAVIGCSDLLMNEVLGELTDKQRQAVVSIKRCAHTLLGSIDQILNYSRLEAGELEMLWDECDVAEVIGQAVERIRPGLPPSGKAFEPEVTVEPEATVWHTDRVKLRHILQCLIENAAFASEEPEVRVGARRTNTNGVETLEISVSDNGRGIPDDQRPTLFEPFQGDIRAQGAGLGLTIAKRLTELLEGVIRVESEVGSGSTFTLAMPQHQAS
jgi:signal transduction histidine kinase